MIYEPAEFQHVRLDVPEKSSCSPRVAAGFEGVAIRMPARITAGAGDRLTVPMCGFYHVPTPTVMGSVDVRVHARNLAAPGAELSGPIVPEPPPGVMVAPPRPAVDPSLFEGQLSQAYLYFDAQKYLPTLGAGTYEIWLTYGPHRSNTARVDIVRR